MALQREQPRLARAGEEVGVERRVGQMEAHVHQRTVGGDDAWSAEYPFDPDDATLGGRVRIGIAATRLVAPSKAAVTVEAPVARPRPALSVPAPVVAPTALAPEPPAPIAAVPVAAPQPERVTVAAPRPAPSAPTATRAPTRVAIPAPPPMELAAAAARQPALIEATAASAPVVVEVVAEVLPPAARAAAGVLVLDGEYVVNDRIMHVRGRPAASLADRVYGVLREGAQTIRRGAALHLAA